MTIRKPGLVNKRNLWTGMGFFTLELSAETCFKIETQITGTELIPKVGRILCCFRSLIGKYFLQESHKA